MKETCNECYNYSICIIRIELEKIFKSIPLKNALDDIGLSAKFESQVKENLASKCKNYDLAN